MHSGNGTGTASRPEREVPGERPVFSAGTYELLALLVATIGVLGLCNNLLVLVLYYRFKRLRTPTNLFLVNISLSDLLVSVCGVSLTFMSCLRSRWVWDAAGCVWDGFSNSLFGGWRGRGRLLPRGVPPLPFPGGPAPCPRRLRTHPAPTVASLERPPRPSQPPPDGFFPSPRVGRRRPLSLTGGAGGGAVPARGAGGPAWGSRTAEFW